MKIKPLLKDKRGMGIGDLYPVILTIAVVAILLAVVMFVLDEWKDVTNTKGGAVTNETVTPTELIANTSVDNSTVCAWDNFAVTNVFSNKTGVVINPGNYTVYSNFLKNDTAEFVGPAGWNVSYSFNWGGKDCELIENITQDFMNFVPWIGIILLVVAAAIVLGVVISSFAGKERV